jgi:transcriptional regulator with XRE-family HTH domain
MSSRPKKLLRQVLAAKVKAARTARGWSQEELGERAGLSQVYLSHVESAKRAVSIDCVEQLADAFGVAPASLLSQ